MKHLRIGVTGYSQQEFDEDAAFYMLKAAFQYLKMQHRATSVELISGLTDMGVPSIAYALATKMKFETTGIACSLAKDFDTFDVDNEVIVGDDWGDESSTFLRSIDVLVRVGGGEQAEKETATAKKRGIPVMEFDLPPLDDSAK